MSMETDLFDEQRRIREVLSELIFPDEYRDFLRYREFIEKPEKLLLVFKKRHDRMHVFLVTESRFFKYIRETEIRKYPFFRNAGKSDFLGRAGKPCDEIVENIVNHSFPQLG